MTKKIIQQRFLSTSNYSLYARRFQLERGSASLMASEHHEPALKTYNRSTLHANFYGPTEWYLMSKRRMDDSRLKDQSMDADQIAEKAKYDHTHPQTYPFTDESTMDQWPRYRELCANLYPGSPFDVEQRVFDSWQMLTRHDAKSTAEFPDRFVHGGIPISQVNQYPFEFEPLMERPAESSEAVYNLYARIHGDCSPYSQSSLDGQMLKDFVQMLSTKEDLTLLLPQVLKRWRWVQMGGRNQHLSNVMDEQLAHEIIQKCCQSNLTSVALHLIRYKGIYALPLSQQSVETVMQSLLLAHLNGEPYTSFQTAYNPTRDDPKELEEDEKLKAYAGKRRVPKKLYPFRGAPRFYFYKPLPHVLNPELSPLDEFEVPQLSRDPTIRRLLPDDQRKKLHLMILERRREQMAKEKSMEDQYVQQEQSLQTESPSEWTRAMDDMAKVYYYATSQNPRFYSLQPTSLMNDMLLQCALTSGEEAKRRANMVFADASNAAPQQPKDQQLVSNGGITSLLAATPADLSMDTILAFSQQNYTPDSLNISSLQPFLLKDGRRMLDYVPGGVHSLPSVSATNGASINPEIRKTIVDKLAPTLLESLKTQLTSVNDPNEKAQLKREWERAVQSGQMESMLNAHPDLAAVWN